MDALSRLWSGTRSHPYTSLQAAESGEKQRKPVKFRQILIIACALVIPSSLFLAYTMLWTTRDTSSMPRPRRFPGIRLNDIADVDARDASLPQHNLNASFPEGLSGRFVKFATQHRAAAEFGYLWTELTALSTLALAAKRAHVFRTLVLPDKTEMPLGLFLSGPAAGGNWGRGVDAPRAISSVFWETVCPAERRRVVDIDAVENELGITSSTDGKTVVDRWAKYLNELPDNCVEVGGSRGIFDPEFWTASDRAISLWPTMASSPVVTRHAWSSPVMRGVMRNLPKIVTGLSPIQANGSASVDYSAYFALRNYDDLLRPLVVLHVPSNIPCTPRFVGWAQIPALPDHDVASAACSPSVQQIVTKAGLALEQYSATLLSQQAPPRRVYIMSDDADLVKRLTEELIMMSSGMWSSVTSSRDLVLQGLESSAKMGIEIEIARRAALFVGNGFSPVTSMVTALRLSQGSSPGSIRFW
ncbi:hypothetical protein EXIGLDRAFT_774538 [Exidia glandulosa HHB12029]|uniref:Uncharacterized protein n=1 Tax=Exidia glandulosa HHB12029 TaxID=1314781 RepID=A0A165EB36_EXIGL|nr:hypothetical protein EXIGLDRAFT_774538 [Exidia glandulosa HHB12029]